MLNTWSPLPPNSCPKGDQQLSKCRRQVHPGAEIDPRIGQFWSALARLWPGFFGTCQTMASISQCCPNFDRHRPRQTKVGPDSTKLGLFWSKFGRFRPTCPESARIDRSTIVGHLFDGLRKTSELAGVAGGNFSAAVAGNVSASFRLLIGFRQDLPLHGRRHHETIANWWVMRQQACHRLANRRQRTWRSAVG